MKRRTARRSRQSIQGVRDPPAIPAMERRAGKSCSVSSGATGAASASIRLVSTQSMSEDWPKVSLIALQEDAQASSTDPDHGVACHLVPVVEGGRCNLLHVVDSETDIVLDVMDIDDLIGAKISIECHSDGLGETIEPAVAQGSVSRAAPTRASNEPASDTPHDRHGRAILRLYAYPRREDRQGWFPWWRGAGTTEGPRAARHRSFRLPPSEDLGVAAQLVGRLQRLAQPQRWSSPNDAMARRVLVLVNPKSGPKRNGPEVLATVVEPMLEQAGLEVTTVVLQHSKHALELARKEATVLEAVTGEPVHIDKFSALVVVGGDGTIHQVLQGLADSNALSIPLGIVGCGTANGFAATLLHEAGERYGVIESVLPICKGETITADLSKYMTTNNSYVSLLTFTWAIVADIDIDSELIHFMGEIRFDLWAVLRILWLRRYRARFSYLEPHRSSSKDGDSMPPLSEPPPSDWKTIETDFILFWASQVSHASMSNHQSPYSRLDDGVFQVFILRSGLSKLRLIQILLGLSSGTHVQAHGVEFVECVAYRLEPLTPGSYNDLDGEVIESGPIQAHVLPGAMTVFGRRKDS